MDHTFYNQPSRLSETPAGPLDMLFPPNFLVSALYAGGGYLLCSMGYQKLGTATKMVSIIPFYRAWEARNYGGDLGKGA